MRSLFKRWGERVTPPSQGLGQRPLDRRVAALFDVLSQIHGADRLVLKAGKLDALTLMRAPDVQSRLVALQRIVFEDPTLDGPRSPSEIPALLDEIEDVLADQLAKQTVEEALEKKVAERMQERQEEYVRELRVQILKEEGGPDNAETLRKYAELEKLEHRGVSKTAFESLRPRSVDEVVGQKQAIRALFAKLCSPYPQHVILYGPPGIGKTSVARLALEYAKKLAGSPFEADAKFVEVDGTTLRWDPREVSNPLLGSVHDPIYQGARREFADTATPEPRPGLVTEAHGGILFIDEIGEMDPMLQNKLLKVLEDKRVRFESAYYDPHDQSVPKYIKKLFEDGAPADFILVGATTRDPAEITPALRSRCADVFFEPLTPKEIQQIVEGAAARLGVTVDPQVPVLIAEYTVEGRKATGILADAYGLALWYTGRSHVKEEHIREVIQASRLQPAASVKGTETAEVGRVYGLGVSGFLGSVIEIEAAVFPARTPGKGSVRFNDAAGSMAKDSVFNAASLIRRLTGQDLSDFDVHVNVVGGGKIDGPSAGAAITTAITSAISGTPIRQDIAITGEVSLSGRVKAVGGVHEKVYGAVAAGLAAVIVPTENRAEVAREFPGIRVIPISTVEELVAIAASQPGAPVQPTTVRPPLLSATPVAYRKHGRVGA